MRILRLRRFFKVLGHVTGTQNKVLCHERSRKKISWKL